MILKDAYTSSVALAGRLAETDRLANIFLLGLEASLLAAVTVLPWLYCSLHFTKCPHKRQSISWQNLAETA